jgi:hypothetical protein
VKLLGLPACLSVPAGFLARPSVRRLAALLPVALLALDARCAGLAGAAGALLLRAPFLVVVTVAVLAAAAVRALTG